MAGKRMVGICYGNKLPVEWHVVKGVGLWSLPVLHASLCSFLEGRLVPSWGLLVDWGLRVDRICPTAH